MTKSSEKSPKKTFAALNDYVQVEPAEAKKEAGGVALSETRREIGTGKVLSVGPGIRTNRDRQAEDIAPVKVGDTIVFNPNLLHEIKVEGKTIYVISFNAIYGRF